MHQPASRTLLLRLLPLLLVLLLLQLLLLLLRLLLLLSCRFCCSGFRNESYTRC